MIGVGQINLRGINFGMPENAPIATKPFKFGDCIRRDPATTGVRCVWLIINCKCVLDVRGDV